MSPGSGLDKGRGVGAGDLFLLGAVFAWGINFPLAKIALDYMDPFVFSATRYLIAPLALFSLLWFRNMPIAITRREALMLAWIGLLGITLFQGGWAYGLNLTSASKASVLVSTSPIFGALISAMLGNRPGWKGWLGILLAFVGVVLVINNSLTELTIGAGSFTGDLMIMGGACAWAVYTIVSGPMIMRRGPLLVTAWAMLFGAGILTVIGLPSIMAQDWRAITGVGWAAWASTTVFGAALAFVWYCAGILRLGVTKGMVYSFFVPVIAILCSVLILGESISLVQIIGAVVILLGVLLTRAD
ncbi:DMT family transporter [Sneathiella sp.]|uniref:DMT family transporter n=1 Tax=Sneathiella sp. TaxID=1964365 RepID=UPI0025E9FD8D|nr:DMT family transporter [Sneathiella sp.]